MKKFKNLTKLIIFLAIVCSLILIFSIVFVPTWRAGNNIKGMYDEKDNSIDAIFIGDSAVFYDISPLEIYDEYGITSYDYASPGVSSITMYYLLKEATLKQKPKVVLADITSIFTHNEEEANIRIAIDSMKWGETKKEFLNDSNYNLSLYDKFTYVLPFFRYHTRFNELKGNDITKLFKNVHNPLKGYYPDYEVKAAPNKDVYMKDRKETIDFSDTDLVISLLKMKDYCLKNNIKLVLTAMLDASVWNYAKNRKMTDWCKSNNITFLDLNMEDTGVDLATDTFDKGIHLNTYGAIKTSHFIGNYLKNNYNLDDHRGDEYYSKWNEDLDFYHQQISRESGVSSEIFTKKYRKKSTISR